MITPRWVAMPAQPIAIERPARLPGARRSTLAATGSPIFEIGGADQVSYGDLMREYARQRGLRRLMIPVPVLTPRLSSLWLGLVTPLYARVGRKLIESIRHPTVVRDDARARSVFGIRPHRHRARRSRRALRNEDREFAATRWSDALSAVGPSRGDCGGVRFGSRLVDSRERPRRRAAAPRRSRRSGASAARTAGTRWTGCGGCAAGSTCSSAASACAAAGAIPSELRVGDALDFWRVEAFEPDRRLRLARRDEGARPRLARVRGDTGRRRRAHPPDRDLRPGRARGPAPTGTRVYPLHALVFAACCARSARARSVLDRRRGCAPRACTAISRPSLKPAAELGERRAPGRGRPSARSAAGRGTTPPSRSGPALPPRPRAGYSAMSGAPPSVSVSRGPGTFETVDVERRAQRARRARARERAAGRARDRLRADPSEVLEHRAPECPRARASPSASRGGCA